jgi:hypothetical protein
LTVTALPQPVRYDTLESFEEIDGLSLSLIKAKGDEDGFIPGPPCLHLVLTAKNGQPERVFSVNAGNEDAARAFGQGMALALSIASDEWSEPRYRRRARRPESLGVVVPFRRRP